MKFKTPYFKITWVMTTALVFTFLSLFSHATDLFSSGDDEFLAVEDAYQAFITQEDGTLEIHWTAEPGYYLYQHQFKVTAQNATEKEKLTPQFEPGETKFDEYFEREVTAYYEQTKVTVNAPQLVEPYELVVKSQACADAGLCYPPRKQYFHIDAGSAVETDGTSFGDSFGDSPSSPLDNTPSNTPNSGADSQFLPFVLLGALLGGLILNLMPCVFPVLSLKALSFTSSHMSGGSQHAHGWAYTAGVVISFVGAALAILLGREAGEALGWGFQLQHPVFVAFMIYLFFIMGLALSGLIEIGTSWMGAGQSLTSGQGLGSSFFTGVLAAVVASPCTAPFMASALGFALTQSIPVALTVFIALGFGMALPFLLLSYIPSLADKLPRPGPWMDTLKQFLAFPLYATCIWLLWVLGRQTSSDGAMAVVLGGLFIALAFWLLRQQPSGIKTKIFNHSLVGLSFIGALFFALEVKVFQAGGPEDQWQAYTPDSLKTLRAEGTPRVLGFNRRLVYYVQSQRTCRH